MIKSKLEKMMKIFKTFSLGCRVNQSEIEAITEQLQSLGYSRNQNSLNPNFILLNTCVVTQKAEKETRKEIRKLKRCYPKTHLLVLGCAVDAKEKLESVLPKADLFINNQKKGTTAKIVTKLFPIHKPQIIKSFCDKYQKSKKALVKIQDGCNHFCTYCIVPSLRGEPKSVPMDTIINQINNLKPKGIKEIILTGISLSFYGHDLKPQTSLLALLKKILKETKIAKISLTSLDPQLVNQEFFNLYLDNPRLSRNLHFSLQSGSPTVLKRMNRNSDLKDFVKYLRQLKNKDNRFVFSADIIVGFPDESEIEFQETLRLIKQIKLNRVHLFRFSPRPGTIAYQKILKGEWQDLPLEIKKEREKIIGSFLPED